MRADDLQGLADEWLNSTLAPVRECGRRLDLALSLRKPACPRPNQSQGEPDE